MYHSQARDCGTPSGSWRRDPQQGTRGGGEVSQLTVVSDGPYMTDRNWDPAVTSVLSIWPQAAGPGVRSPLCVKAPSGGVSNVLRQVRSCVSQRVLGGIQRTPAEAWFWVARGLQSAMRGVSAGTEGARFPCK